MRWRDRPDLNRGYPTPEALMAALLFSMIAELDKEKYGIKSACYRF